MKPKDEIPKKAENHLDILKNYLDIQFKEVEIEEKPPHMTWDEMKIFFNTKIEPVYKKINDHLSAYKFDDLQYNIHRRVATLRIAEKLSLFSLKVDIANSSRQIVIFYELAFRSYAKTKLTKLRLTEREIIPFKEIDNINEELLLGLFTKWYTNKEKTIEEYKEYQRIQKEKEKQENKTE